MIDGTIGLKHASAFPPRPAQGATLLVLLHGRGADSHDLLSLRPYLPSDWLVVAPEAPFPAAPWGYGPGGAWYRFLGGARPEPESFAHSLDRLGAFLTDLGDQLPVEPGEVVVGGFSQGGTLSIAYAIAAAAGLLGDGAPSVRRVVNLSGFLAEHPSVEAGLEHARGIEVFWAHGTQDRNIPFTLAMDGRERLRAAGAEVRARDYVIGHSISAAEVLDLVRWVQRAEDA